MLPTTLHFYTLQVKTLIDLFSSSFVSSTTSIVFQNTSASIESFLRSGGHPLFSYQLIFSYQFFFHEPPVGDVRSYREEFMSYLMVNIETSRRSRALVQYPGFPMTDHALLRQEGGGTSGGRN